MSKERLRAAGAIHSVQVTANGHPFHILECGQGPAVLFCHGFPDTALTWRSQLNAVAAAGYRAIALDMRGFGDSYSPADFHLYTSLHVVGDLVGVLDALQIDRAVVVGHDWGADYAQRACVMRPDRFGALVSVSIPFAPRGERSLWEDLRARGLDSYYAFDLGRTEADEQLLPARDTILSALYWLSGSPPPGTGWDPIDPELGMLRPSPVLCPEWADPAYVAHTIRTFERTGFHAGLNYYRVVQVTFDLTAAFKGATLRQPSLYIWGTQDGLCRFFHPTPPTDDELRAVQPNLIGQLRLDGVGHWPQHEAADEFNASLLQFLHTLAAET